MVYWSGRGGSVLVGLLSVVGRFPEICHQLNPFIVFVALLFRSPDRSIGSTGLGIIYLSFFFVYQRLDTWFSFYIATLRTGEDYYRGDRRPTRPTKSF